MTGALRDFSSYNDPNLSPLFKELVHLLQVQHFLSHASHFCAQFCYNVIHDISLEKVLENGGIPFECSITMKIVGVRWCHSPLYCCIRWNSSNSLNRHILARSWIAHASHAQLAFCWKAITKIGSFPEHQCISFVSLFFLPSCGGLVPQRFNNGTLYLGDGNFDRRLPRWNSHRRARLWQCRWHPLFWSFDVPPILFARCHILPCQ